MQVNPDTIKDRFRACKELIAEGYEEEKETLKRLIAEQQEIVRLRGEGLLPGRVVKVKKPRSRPKQISLPVDLEEKRLVCFDVEAWEWNQKKILEVGLSVFENGVITTHHFIIKENLKYENKKFAKSNKFAFDFGESITCSLEEAVAFVRTQLNSADYLVGHHLRNDFKFLKISTKRNWFDTSTLSKEYNDGNRMKLGKLAKMFGVELARPHNAGNDSHVTMETFLVINRKKMH